LLITELCKDEEVKYKCYDIQVKSILFITIVSKGFTGQIIMGQVIYDTPLAL